MQETDKKTAMEIFGNIPFPLKIVVVVGSLFIVFVFFYVSYLLLVYEAPKKGARVITLSDSRSAAGLLDPSIATDGSRRVLAYTIVEPMTDGSFSTEVLLATGNKDCILWNALGSKMESRPDRLIGPDLITPVANGFWRAETPSLVYDPADTGREWKLFAYRYFWSGSAPLARLYGVIVMRTTDSATSANWSNEEWLLSASENAPPQPYADLVKAKLNTLHADLGDVYFYARPSVVNVDNVLVMSLSAFVQGKNSPDRIILLASTDHARSWRYLGTALRESDLSGIGAGFTHLSGGGLFMKEGVMYLSAMLGTKDSDAVGAHIFEFENATTAKLSRRAGTNALVVLDHVETVQKPPSRTGGGALAYNDSCPGITFMSESVDGRRHDIFAHPRPPVK